MRTHTMRIRVPYEQPPGWKAVSGGRETAAQARTGIRHTTGDRALVILDLSSRGRSDRRPWDRERARERRQWFYYFRIRADHAPAPNEFPKQGMLNDCNVRVRKCQILDAHHRRRQ